MIQRNTTVVILNLVQDLTWFEMLKRIQHDVWKSSSDKVQSTADPEICPSQDPRVLSAVAKAMADQPEDDKKEVVLNSWLRRKASPRRVVQRFWIATPRRRLGLGGFARDNERDFCRGFIV